MGNNKARVYYFFLYPFLFKHRRLIRSHILRLFQTEGTSLASLSIIFCSDEQLHQMNVQYLSHDTLTDILTFPLSSPPDLLVGEIYISVERVRDNAALYKVSFAHELLRVIFHGCLHLCGYDDKTPALKKIMTQKEDFYLARFHNCST